MSWPLVKLKNCCDVVGGATPKRNVDEYWGSPDIPWVTPKDISNLDSPILNNAPEYISKAGFKSCATYILPKGSVLVTSRAPIGNIAIAGRDMCTNQGFKSLVPSEKVDGLYLYYCMSMNSEKLQSLGNGATFKEVSKKIVEEFEIPLPPLPEQKRIAAILDKADAIRRKRQQAIQLADEFLRAVFLDMFGEPSDGWLTMPFIEIAGTGKNTFVNGPFGSDLLTSELRDEGVPVIYIQDIRTGRFNKISNRFVTKEKSEQLSSCEVLPNDVIIAKVGDPPGTAALYPLGQPRAIITQDVVRIRPDLRKVTPEFIVGFLNSSLGERWLKPIVVEATRSRFGLGEIKKKEFLLPPINMQKHYSEIYRKITEKREKLVDSEYRSVDLFKSLSQKAFAGKQ